MHQIKQQRGWNQSEVFKLASKNKALRKEPFKNSLDPSKTQWGGKQVQSAWKTHIPYPSSICRLERGKCLGRFAGMFQSQAKAHQIELITLFMVPVTSRYDVTVSCQALNLAPCSDLSSHSCINMTEQMGPWKKRWKNRKLAIFTSEENRVWTCKWRTRDNRDKCTCHQLVNQWWKLISTRVNKGITSWTNECNRCDRVITPCSYHNREWMLGSNVHSRKGYNMKKEWRTQVTFIYIALLTIQIVSKQLSNIKIGK